MALSDASMRESIRAKFGLDYSGIDDQGTPNLAARFETRAKGGVGAAFEAGLGESFRAYSAATFKVLGRLYSDTDSKARMMELVDTTGIDFDDMSKIIEQLAGLGLVNYVERDRRAGNHLIQLTDDGKSLLSQ